MKMKGNLQMSVILVTIMASIISAGVLALKMNMFLLCTINMFSVSAVIFLVYEKKIIQNFSKIWKDGLVGGMLLSIAYIAFMSGVSMTSAMDSLIFLFAPVALFFGFRGKKRNSSIIFTAAVILISVLDIFLIKKQGSILGTLLLLGASITIYSLLSWAAAKKHILETHSKEVLCIMALSAAAVSFILFYLTKPSYAPVLTQLEQYHLINIIIFGSILPAFFFTFSTSELMKSDIRVASIVFTLTAVLLSFTDFSLLLIPAYILISLPPFFKGAVNKKGFSTTEIMALITLSAIIVSLIFPFTKAVSVKRIIASDINSIKPGSKISGSFDLQIGNLYARQIDGSIRCIYEDSEGRIKSYPIQ